MVKLTHPTKKNEPCWKATPKSQHAYYTNDESVADKWKRQGLDVERLPDDPEEREGMQR